MTDGPAELRYVHHPRARRYILKLTREGAFAVTIPRRGSLAGARKFAHAQADWMTAARTRWRKREDARKARNDDTKMLCRGTEYPVEVDAEGGVVRLGPLIAPFRGHGDPRAALERRMRQLAAVEFPRRVRELARLHGIRITRVSVRAQRSRWGSCSRAGTISLNWRLIQAPDDVLIYVIIHELMHLREMNHSDRFWGHVAIAMPSYEAAERWLKAHGWLLVP